jgi:phosphatidylinositol kinase/protein kinase (PI-3  family)
MSIKNKLRGKRRHESIPLSVPGQVEYLIQQAISLDNLSKMYSGWAAYL